MFPLVVRSCFVAMVAAVFLVSAGGAPADSIATTAPVSELKSVPQTDGRLGVAILDFQTSRSYHHNGTDPFTMQSVFKAMAAATVMQQVDAGKLSLDQEVAIGPEDISVFWSPIADEFDGTSATYTVRELLEKAVGLSDNTAADVLMELVGGPAVVTQMLREAGIEGVRVDRYERQFQPELEGLPPFELGEVIDREKFVEAAEAVPSDVKRPLLERCVSGEDKRDTATPLGAVDFLVKLQEGKLMLAESTRVLLQIMTDVKTGTARLKAGLPAGSKLAHKTGTGGDILGVNTATNDIGIATLPDGRKFAVAVFLTGSKESAEKREAVHAEVVRRFVDEVLAIEGSGKTTSTMAAPTVERFRPLPAPDLEFDRQIKELVVKAKLDERTPASENPDKEDEWASICVVDLADLHNPRVGGWEMENFVYPASTYKMYVMGEAIRQVCEGKLSLDQPTTISQHNDRGDGRLVLGEAVPLAEVLRLMMMYSDNTAANVAIDVVGRKNATALLESLGCRGSDVTRKFLPRTREDAEFTSAPGTLSNALHFATFLYAAETGAIGDGRGRGLIKGYLATNVQSKGRFAAGLPQSATLYSKTGEWNTFTAEAALVEDGETKYIVIVMTAMPYEKAAPRMAAFVKDVHQMLKK